MTYNPTIMTFKTFVPSNNIMVVRELTRVAENEAEPILLTLVKDNPGVGMTHLLRATAEAGFGRYIDLERETIPNDLHKESLICLDNADLAAPEQYPAIIRTLVDRYGNKRTVVGITGRNDARKDLMIHLAWGPSFRVSPLTRVGHRALLERVIRATCRRRMSKDQLAHVANIIRVPDNRQFITRALTFTRIYQHGVGFRYAIHVLKQTAELDQFAGADQLPSAEPVPKLQQILEAVSQVTGISEKTILGPQRSRNVVIARHLTIYLTRTLNPHLTLIQIGEFISGLDHSSVLYAINKITHRLLTDTKLRELLENVQAKITNALKEEK